MPNIAPRGLYPRHGGAWKNPTMIYARVAGVWKQAKFVYAYRNGAWQLIWGAEPVAATSVTAAWLKDHSVRITIVSPAVNTNTHWIVRRGDASIVATVPVSQLVVDDLTPLLTSVVTGTKTLAAYTVEGYNGIASSAKKSTGTVAWNLDPATVTLNISYPNATTATVGVNWTPNPTYGEPDGWKVYRASSPVAWFPVTDVLPGLSRALSIASQPRGQVLAYRAIPFSKNAAGAWVQAGNDINHNVNSKAATPASVVLTAPTSPDSTLRLTWASGGGTVTAYEVERSTNGTTWTAHTDDASPADWATTVKGWMRVRATSPGGVSDWAQAGPVTPHVDTGGPGQVVINSFKPESSYGRLVIRFTTPAAADMASYRVKWRFGASGAVTNESWVAIGPSTAKGHVVGTFDAGDNVQAGIDTKDDLGNITIGHFAGYLLVASPINLDPSGSLSGTHDGVAWRNDATRGPTELCQGISNQRHNMGCFFYGTTIIEMLSAGKALGRTYLSVAIQHYRENEGGNMSAVVPRFNLHQLATRSGTPFAYANGASEASMNGPGLVRSTPVDTNTFTLPSQFLAGFEDGTYKGICFYKGVPGGDGDPDSYYMQLGIGGQVPVSGVLNGRLKFSHLG